MTEKTISFRYKCYRNMLKTFGVVDASAECIELSVREFIRQSDGSDFNQYLREKSKINHIELSALDIASWRLRASQLYILSVYQQFEEFLNNLKEESKIHFQTKENNTPFDNEGTTKFHRVIKAFRDSPECKIEKFEEDIIDHYRKIRNIFMHAEINDTKADSSASNIRKKIQKLKASTPKEEKKLDRLKTLDAPNPYNSINFDDFILFTKTAKNVAEKLCILGRPSDQQIFDLIKTLKTFEDVKQKYHKKPNRLENSLVTLCRCEYSINESEAKNLINKFLI